MTLPPAATRRERRDAIRAAGGATIEAVCDAWQVDAGEAAVLLVAAGLPVPDGLVPVRPPAPEPTRPMRTGRPSLLRSLLSGIGYLDLDLSPLQDALVDLAACGVWPSGEVEQHRAALDDDEAELDAATEIRRTDVGGGSIRYRARLGTEPGARPDSVCVVAGVRGGKTTIAACALVANALEADLSALRKGEVAHGVIVAPTLEAAGKTFEDLVHLLSTPRLKGCVVDRTPQSAEAEEDGETRIAPSNRRVRIKRADGRHVVLRVVAASKGGLTSRSRWLVGAVLEEAAYFGSEGAGAAVSAEDQYAAVADRIVPGGQVWLISSPNGPSGLLYETWRKVPEGWAVIHAPTRAMNPGYPQERVDRAMRRDPDRARRELGAEFLDGETALLPGEWIERATRSSGTTAAHSRRIAAMDPATRGNGWTVVVADRTADGVAVVAAREWRGSKSAPLSPSATLREIAAFLRPLGVTTILTDKHQVDSLRDLAQPLGLVLSERHTSPGQAYEHAQRVRSLLGDCTLTLPDVPDLHRDMRSVKRILTRHGATLLLPKTPDGRHADYWPSLSLCVWELRTAAAPEAVEEDEFAHGRPFGMRSERRDAARPWARA